MKALRIACLLLLAAPPTARAADATITMREIPLHGSRVTAALAAPQLFDLVGLHWRGSGSVAFRTQSVSGRWSAWRPAAPESEDGPDLGVSETTRVGWRVGNPWWTGQADRIEVHARGHVSRVRAWFVSSPVASVPLRRVSIAGSPAIVPRVGWNADEKIRRGPPAYAPLLQLAIVHHTAGSNNYGPAESAAIVRGIELYHVQANGWKDIGYNFLVDRFGQVFEGRFGGIERNVIGAHAEGFNTGSVGVALIGTYSSAPPPTVAEAALAKLLAWRLDVAHVDPASSGLFVSRGNPRFPIGTPVYMRAISGHRDAGFTACPGNGLYRRLSSIIEVAATTGLPKLYEPRVRGRIGTRVRFSARLSAPMAWTVTVTGRSAQVVARKSSVGDRIAWVWNSAGQPLGRYTWTIEAGPKVRPARGVVGTGQELPSTPPRPPPPPPLLSDLSISPSIVSPNGDGYADEPTISYALSRRARVTVTLTDANGYGTVLVFDQQQGARRQSFPWGMDAFTDGWYTLTVSARTDNGRTGELEGQLLISRTLGAVTATPSSFSPDGDGLGDTITFSFTLTRAAQVWVEVRQNGVPLAVIFSGPLDAGPQSFLWDGRLADGVISPGRYEVWVTAADDIGTVSQPAPFEAASRPG